MRYRAIRFALISLGATVPAHASSLTSTQEFVAEFEFNLLGGAVLDPGPDTDSSRPWPPAL